MSQRLSTGWYIFLLCINFIIGLMAAYSMGLHHDYLNKVDAAIVKASSIIFNRSKILDSIRKNCTQLLVQFPELEVLPAMDLCDSYRFSIKFSKVVVIISTLYDTYLPYGL